MDVNMNVLAQLMLFPSLTTTVTVTALSPGLGGLMGGRSSPHKAQTLKGRTCRVRMNRVLGPHGEYQENKQS